MIAGRQWGTDPPTTPEEVRKRWPEATEKDVPRIVRYLNGDPYHFSPPQACSALWGALAWSRVVVFDEVDEDEDRERIERQLEAHDRTFGPTRR